MATKTTPKLKTFTIIEDTREQRPLDFSKFSEIVGVKRATLPTGDYSIEGWGGRLLSEDKKTKEQVWEPFGICIERKADLNELIGNMTVDHDQFERRLWRMMRYEVAIIMVECGSLSDAMNGRYRSFAEPKSVAGWLCAIEEKYHIPIRFFNNRSEMEENIRWTMQRFLERQARYSRWRAKMEKVTTNHDEMKVMRWDWNQLLLRQKMTDSLLDMLIDRASSPAASDSSAQRSVAGSVPGRFSGGPLLDDRPASRASAQSCAAQLPDVEVDGPESSQNPLGQSPQADDPLPWETPREGTGSVLPFGEV